jgi:dienelactone hydrolase
MNLLLRSSLEISIVIVTALLVPNSVVAESLRERIVQNHRAYLPAAEGVFPTLIAVPGCSGVSLNSPATDEGRPGHKDDILFRLHYPRVAERLRADGFAVLLIDILGAEGVNNACGGEIPADRIADYIAETAAWATSLPYVDRSRLHVLGWSLGGWGVLSWLHDARESESAVRSAVAVYPGCYDCRPLKAQIPLLLLLGAEDDIADPAVCERLIESSPTKSLVTLRRYDGARHGFDVQSAPPVLDIGNGMTVGYQEAAATAAWQEILHFLGSST